MAMLARSKSTMVLLLCLIALVSSVEASGLSPKFVSADNSLTVQILRAPASTESISATGLAEVKLDTGQLRVELHHGTPVSVYTVLFASSSANLQIGTLVTDSGGEGNLQATLSSGAYVGIFEISRLLLVQFASASVSFTIGASISVSGASTTETSITSEATNASVTNSTQEVFQVEPPSSSIIAGEFAKFNIRITEGGLANVFLVARDVPGGGVAIFTPNEGLANPEFHSTLTVITSANTPAGSYSITIVARINMQESTAQVALQVSAPTTTQSTTATTPVAAGLSLIVTTDRSQYQPNSSVTVQGHVTDMRGSAVANATVSIQVDSPTGAEVFFTNSVQTDSTGTFQAQFNLRGYVVPGTYTVFASAAKINYSNVASRTTFVIGSSTTPSVVVSAVYAGDSSGNPLATFSAGQTIWIWVVVHNIGVTFQGVIWVQVRDPNGVPVEIRIHITNLHAGESIKDGIGFTLLGNPTLGVYRVDALVSDKLISQGGSFLANGQTQFAITG